LAAQALRVNLRTLPAVRAQKGWGKFTEYGSIGVITGALHRARVTKIDSSRRKYA